MDCVVIDLTHGGIKIAISFAKKKTFENIYAYDIYNTIDKVDKEFLKVYGIKLIKLEDLKNMKNNLTVIYPIHLPLSKQEIKNKINNPNISYSFLTHHQAIKELLKEWGNDILKVEVTGVKGKTSSVFMLKNILIDSDPLILSSLGAIQYNNGKEKILKKNISITPANIKETIDLAYKIANPICEISSGLAENKNNKNYKSAIFESSLGASGIGDVGLLTNISENYPIAKNKSDAKTAKKQIFNCNIVTIEKETLNKYYPEIKNKKINTFSFEDKSADLFLSKINYGLNKTILSVKYHDLITVDDEYINGKLEIETFAPGHYHVQNVLGVITASLTLGIEKFKIQKGLKNYKGIDGRTNKKNIGNSTIIEEINPGINTTSIKESVEMIKHLNNYDIIIGGDYGITCEEIDESKVANYLDSLDENIILTGPVGRGILEKMNKKLTYITDYKTACENSIKNNKNILFIYRSNYKELNKR